jgi:hypothetical protein
MTACYPSDLARKIVLAFSTSSTRLRPITAGAVLIGAVLAAQTAQAAVAAETCDAAKRNRNGQPECIRDRQGERPHRGRQPQRLGDRGQRHRRPNRSVGNRARSERLGHQPFVQPQHLIGRFHLSTTTDDRSTFAHGLASGGGMTATWTALENPIVTPVFGMTVAALVDNWVLVSGTIPATGIPLEMMEDASLPTNGPGTQPGNANFVLSEFQVSATAVPVPVPVALPLMAGGLRRRVCWARAAAADAPLAACTLD